MFSRNFKLGNGRFCSNNPRGCPSKFGVKSVAQIVFVVPQILTRQHAHKALRRATTRVAPTSGLTFIQQQRDLTFEDPMLLEAALREHVGRLGSLADLLSEVCPVSTENHSSSP